MTYNRVVSNSVTVPVTDASPALFTATSTGVGQAALLNEDVSVNPPANPSAKGSVLVLFGTGEGETSPTGVDGQLANGIYPVPVLPLSVTIDGKSAPILYGGGAPGKVAGLFQINATVPPNASSGAVKIVVAAGTRSSPANTVTISVR